MIKYFLEHLLHEDEKKCLKKLRDDLPQDETLEIKSRLDTIHNAKEWLWQNTPDREK